MQKTGMDMGQFSFHGKRGNHGHGFEVNMSGHVQTAALLRYYYEASGRTGHFYNSGPTGRRDGLLNNLPWM